MTLGEYNISISARGINHDLNTPDDKNVTISVGSLSGWNYRKNKTINGTTAGAQTNYQMKLTVHNTSGTDTPGVVYLNGSARSDFGDLRFTKSDGVTLLDYWIESYTSGTSAVVWVEVDSIPASSGTADIYLYYGNPSATSASSGAATFVFFDDFSGDLSQWDTSNPSGTWSIDDGKLKSINNDYTVKPLISNFNMIDTYVVEGETTSSDVSTPRMTNILVRYVSSSNLIYGNFQYSYRRYLSVRENSVWTSDIFASATNQANVWYKFRFTEYPHGIYEWYSVAEGGSNPATVNVADTVGYTGKLALGAYYTKTTWYDNIRVRKYVSPQPAWGSS